MFFVSILINLMHLRPIKVLISVKKITDPTLLTIVLKIVTFNIKFQFYTYNFVYVYVL